MKITVTRDEVKEMIANKLGLKVRDFTLVIAPSVTTPLFSKIPMLNDLVDYLIKEEVVTPSEGRNLVILPGKKIQAIRAVRSFYYDNKYPCELSAAKAIVEEWDLFVAGCKRINGFITNPDDFPWRK